MRVELFILATTAACLHRPSDERAERLERYRSRPAPEVLSAAYVPHRAVHSADLIGVDETWASSTTSFDLAFFNHLEEEDEGGAVAAPVRPILAVTGTVVTFDIPMSDDERVDQWVEYLTGRGRDWYAKWLGRSTRFVPLFWRILESYDLPKDLVFLSMIESGFSPSAYSWAHAAGPWQFIASTGRQYGLQIDFWVDERRDFELATHAAARYLRRLYEHHGDWYLAWAAYNAGSGRVERAIRRIGTRDFWKLSRSWHLRRETKHYVPKLLAAAKIAKQPDLHGFEDVVYLPPLAWDVLTVTVATDLGTIAKACGTEESELVGLNPALRTEVTPPGTAYPVRVPEGTAGRCAAALAAMPDRWTYRYYEVNRNVSLAEVAKRFRTTPEAILEFNGMEAPELGGLDELVIPVPLAAAGEVPIVTPPHRRYRPNRYGPEGAAVVIHEVEPGDSLWRIARRYRVSLRKLRLWNGMWKAQALKVGQKIRVYRGGGRAPR